MAKRIVTIDGAVSETGLSKSEIYMGLKSGKYCGFRAGGPHGKWLLDLDLFEKRIEELMLQNIRIHEEDKSYGKLRKIGG